MAVDPELTVLLDTFAQIGFPRIGSISVQELRAWTKVDEPLSTDVETNRIVIPTPLGDLPGRLYRPDRVADALIVYFHGGGWVFGGLNMVDAPLCLLSAQSRCAILSVDYRLAPEYPFPAAVEDALSATNWASEQLTLLTGRADARLIVAGDSAGGNLAAVVSRVFRDRNWPAIALQLLIYPVLTDAFDPTVVAAIDPPFMGLDELRWLIEQYTTPDQRDDPLFAPGAVRDLSNLPPAVILNAEYDLLAHQGRAYATRLIEAGGQAIVLEYAGGVHGFVTFAPASRIAGRAIEDMASCIRRVGLGETL